MKSCVRIMRRTTEAKDFKAEATGTLFSIAGLHFLVTAAHVFDGGPDLWLDNAPANKVATLVHQRACRVDELDIAFVELKDELVATLRGSLGFLTMQDVKLHVPPNSRLALTGFPQELNVGERYALGYWTPMHMPGPGVKYDPETQVVLRYDMSFSAGEDGTSVGLPDSLKGMSGCPVWWVDPAKPMTAESMRLAAVQTCTEPIAGVPYLKLVKATRWFAVLAAMTQVYPDLQRAMQLYFGEEAAPRAHRIARRHRRQPGSAADPVSENIQSNHLLCSPREARDALRCVLTTSAITCGRMSLHRAPMFVGHLDQSRSPKCPYGRRGRGC